MKPIVVLLACTLLLAACASPKTLLRNGRYDAAIYKSVRKLKKDPDKIKIIAVLTEAYRVANERDLERISFLKKSGQPEIWEEVFTLYSTLKNRQDAVKTLPAEVLNRIGFKITDYDNDVIESKRKAAEYFYAHAMTLLSKAEKLAAREAYEDLLKVKSYYATYKDVDTQLQYARALGMTHVLFKMNNVAPVMLPAGFEDDLLNIAVNDLDSRWVDFDPSEAVDRTYDNVVLLTIRMIDVSPERYRERTWVESREVEDGWKYVYDAHGNVKKDSAGNDIKETKYKTISCQLIETNMNKTAVVSGMLEFYDNLNSQLLKSEPITAQSNFDHVFIVAHGDLNALKPETRQRLGTPLPFPNDLDMIMMSDDILKDAAKSIIHSNTYLFK